MSIQPFRSFINPGDHVDTRNIILQQGRKKVYYIPGYLRIKVKNFTQMNLDNLNAKMNATIIFTIYYGKGPLKDPQNIEKLKKDIILLFGRDNAIKLTEQDNLQTKIQNNEEKCQLKFTVRKLFQLRIESDIFWSPFEIINLILTITVQPVQTPQGTVKINLLDVQDENDLFTKLSYTDEGTFGNYDLAEKRMRATYTNDRVCNVQNMMQNRQQQNKLYQDEIQKQTNFDKINHFQYAHFNVPLYKFPLVALATIFIPLWLLAVINLGIFFQDYSLSDRIASIASLMIAFVALIPTIREQIPPNPEIVFVEYLVYAQTLTSLFALIHSLDIRKDETFSLVWYQDGLFLVSAIITLLTFISVVILLILHYAKWQKEYNKDEIKKQNKKKDQSEITMNSQISKKKKGSKDEGKFNRLEWENKNCDCYFTFMNEKKVKNFFYIEQPLEKAGTQTNL